MTARVVYPTVEEVTAAITRMVREKYNLPEDQLVRVQFFESDLSNDICEVVFLQPERQRSPEK
jgi:hypothetical protein